MERHHMAPTLKYTLIGIFVCVTACFGATSVQINVKDLQAEGVRLIPSTDPTFTPQVEALWGGALTRELETLKPFSVLLRNDSSRTVIAYSVRWVCTAPDGKTFVRNMFSPNLSPDIDNGLSIPVGQLAFVSPTHAITTATAAKARNTAGGRGGAVLQPDADRKIAEAMWKQASVTISIDGVVFSGGEFVGPDESHTYDMARGITQARRQLITEFVERKNSGEGDAATDNWLKAIANPAPSRDRVAIDWVAIYRSSAASNLLRIKRSNGASAAVEFAKNQLSRPHLQLWKRN
jgi:hypothetical protein